MSQKGIYRMLLCGLITCTAAAREELMLVDSYIAAVNDRVITDGDIREYLGREMEQVLQNTENDERIKALDALYRKGLSDLIDRALILEDFDAQGFQVPEKIITEEQLRFVSRHFNGSRVQFEQALMNENTTLEEWRTELRDNLKVQMLQQREVFGRIALPPVAVSRAYQENLEKYRIPAQVKFRLIELNRGNTKEEREAKLNELNQIRERLTGGADFAAVAREVSEGSRAESGGEFPWISPGDLRPELAEVLQQQPVNTVSEALDTGDALYLVLVEARRESRIRPFDEVREELEKELRAREAEALHRRWMERLRGKHVIQIFNLPE
jgi:peptidyl-prolyl cis-trans isomerase SurA